jgi:hypothetical protein
MEFEFDKEMDAILRKARGDEVLTSAEAHLDADEISAFAENAVSDAARQRFTAHFADCTRCRKILSNVIVFNAEAETETASSAVSVAAKTEKTPWYRGLFAFPQIAYAMGALVLLFSGFFGYLILQNLPGAGISEVSYSTNTNAAPAMEKSAPASNSTVFSAANANTASAPTNSTVQTNTSATSNSAPNLPSNSSVSAAPPEKTSAVPETRAPAAEVQPVATPAAKPQTKDADTIAGEDDKTLAKITPAAPIDQPSAAGAARQERAREDSSVKEAQKNEALSEQQKLKTTRSAPQTSKKQDSGAGEMRSVGGKTFNNVGGIWFDSALGKQKQKTVRRGTGEYSKLDAGLRSIADNLGGTVVILWNGKAYRIQ